MPEPFLPNADPDLSSKIDIQDLDLYEGEGDPSIGAVSEARDDGLSQSDQSAARIFGDGSGCQSRGGRTVQHELAVLCHRRHLDAGLASHVAGLLTAAAIMALSLG